MRLSFVVPCYNEQDNVWPFYEAVVHAMEGTGISYELVMVNDGSRDLTAQRLEELYQKKKEETPLTMIRFSRNFGKEAAILAGMRRAVGELVVFIDADLQQRPEVVVDMVRYLDEHPECDCVAAYQAQRKEGRVLTFFKNRFYQLINQMCEIHFVSGASDFRTCRRSMINAILDLPEYYRFSKGIFSWVGFETYFMPYEVQVRNAGESKWSFWKLFRYAIDGMVGFSTAPLRLATFVGIASSAAAVIYMLVEVIKCLVCGIDVPGYSTIVCLILLLGGIQLLVLGILGEYLAKTYMQGKNRPIYVEKQVLGGREGAVRQAAGMLRTPENAQTSNGQKITEETAGELQEGKTENTETQGVSETVTQEHP